MNRQLTPHRTISWNSVSVGIPRSWQTIIADKKHLIFEQNFKAICEVRWKDIGKHSFAKLRKSAVAQWQTLSRQELKSCSLPKTFKNTFSNFKVECYKSNSMFPQMVFLYCPKCSLFLMLQFFADTADTHPLSHIKSLSCHSASDKQQFWTIQDISIVIPKRYNFAGYNIKAGLTTLHFCYNKTALHICRLAPAAVRLAQNSLTEILCSLTGLDDLTRPATETETEIQYSREPSIPQQIVLRLQRKKPFIRAFLRHDSNYDRLLAVTMEGTNPISQIEYAQIRDSYEIVPENT